MELIFNKLRRKYNITSLWHFSDASNLESILKYGLLSLNALAYNNIEPNYSSSYGSRVKDKKEGFSKYVRLSFVKYHPMYYVAKKEGRIKNPIWIEIDLSVLKKRGVKVSDKIAFSEDANIFSPYKIFYNIDFDDLVYGDFEERKEAGKAEILVPYKIEPSYFIKIHKEQKYGGRYGKKTSFYSLFR